MKIIALYILICFFTAGCDSSTNKEKEINYKEIYFTVSKVSDGDTFTIDKEGKKVRIRPIGLDAPESHKTSKEDKQCYGREATEYLKRLILGKKVRIELDKDEIDQYKRTLAYVYLEDSTFVNAELVRNGYADTMNFAPNLKYKDTFLILRNEAKENKRGMWGQCF